MRFIFILFVILLSLGSAYGAYLLLSMPGGMQINAFGLEIELNVFWSVVALLLIGCLIALTISLLTGFWRLPKRIGKGRTERRRKQGNQALADGLLAAEAGDAKAALRHAKKAAQYAEDERLKLLLEARAAEASDDWSGAERAWGQLARLPGGQLAGLRGAAAAAAERGDGMMAEARAKEALAIKSDADWPFQSLFDLQVAKGDWKTALETLALGAKRGLVSGDSLRRRRAVLHTARAASLGIDQRQLSQKSLAEAIRAAPAFPPAAWHGARQLMAIGKTKAAQGVLELAWKARPHPALAQLARRLSKADTPEVIGQRLTALADSNPEHRESRILQAEIAMDAQNWVTAVKILADLVEQGATARLCLLMERALKGYGDKTEAGRWARMALTASREADWSDLDPKGSAFEYSTDDWARLVYKFGDVGELVHPRYEQFGRELEAGRVLALPAPEDEDDVLPESAKAPSDPVTPPATYVVDED